jgi:hypothetical protein
MKLSGEYPGVKGKDSISKRLHRGDGVLQLSELKNV